MWLVAVGLICVVTAATSSQEEEEADKEVRKQELFLLAKLLHPSKLRQSNRASLALNDLDLEKGLGNKEEMKKRQGAWDMDYGWGGGRFGKRADMLDYGWGGGRFGKRADMLDYGWGGGRFGKRSGDMLDYGWGGGRFGKRSTDTKQKKQYDSYNQERRFGRDVDHVDPADEDQ